MAKFAKNYPVLSGRVVSSDGRERVMLVAAGGLFLFLIFVLIAVIQFRQPADANQDIAQAPIPAPAAVGTVTLLTPERFVRIGTKLSDIKFKAVYWPRNEQPEGAVRDESELTDFYASVDLAPGVPVQRSFLTKEPLGISLPLTPGNRAVSIEVDATSSVEGYALPGTRVDVVLTYTDQGNMTSKVLVQNARVLSYAGDSTVNSQIQTRGIRTQGKTITLDVAPGDALKIQTARELGRLSLLMRSADDNKTAPVIDVDSKDIGANGNSKPRLDSCRTGVAKFNGKEFIVGCGNGAIQQIDTSEP